MITGNRSRSVVASGGGGGGAWTIIGSHTVSGGAVQDVTLGSSGGDVAHTFETGYAYRVAMALKPGTPGSAVTYSIEPNNSTSNLKRQQTYSINTTVSAVAGTDGAFAASTGPEQYRAEMTWEEIAGFDRVFLLRYGYLEDTGPDLTTWVDQGLWWAQTPAEDDMNTNGLVVHASVSDGFANGSYFRLERRAIT